MQYRPIKSLPQYKSYESYLEKLLWIKDRSPSEQEEVDLLISLIKTWDGVNGTKSAVLPEPIRIDPVNILDRLMKENKINASDLATALNLSQSGMSDLLNYRKEISPEIIAKLSERFQVTPDIFGLKD
ncbi:MAG: helix-turn-helix transcriptional regulator [Bacteroidota bacterium]|nr:helix-turn-helix transcriptional regulator [Bacteroidota bacterium]MDP4251302.1 helix-turn-helix transcriptional regulator [Bacteroidota bacterium]